MPGRKREPSFQLASGTTNERDNSYNISNTLGSIFYNTDTSNVEVYHEDPSNNVGWRDLVMNNKEQIDISGNVDIRNNLSVGSDNFNQSQIILLAGAGGLNGTGGSQGTATSDSEYSSDYTAVKAFNGSLQDVEDAWHNKNSTIPVKLRFEFPYAVIVTKYKIWPRAHPTHNGTNGEGPSDWALQGSNDGTTFVDIDPRSAQSVSPVSTSTSITNDSGLRVYTVDNTTNAYRYIRLDISGSQKSTDVVSIGEIAYYGYIDGTITATALAVDKITFRDGNNMNTNMVRSINTYTNDATFTVNNSTWVIILSTPTPYTRYSAGSRLHLHFSTPVRNPSNTWGGCYLYMNYNINSTGDKSLGNTGFVNVMEEFGGDGIGLVNVSYLLDINLTAAYTCQFKVYAKSYDNNLYVNIPAQTSHGLGHVNTYGINRYLNYTRLTVTEYGPNSI